MRWLTPVLWQTRTTVRKLWLSAAHRTPDRVACETGLRGSLVSVLSLLMQLEFGD